MRQKRIPQQLQKHLPAGRGGLCVLDAGCGLAETASARLIGSELDELRISMDAASADTYASVRGSDRLAC